jgi:hypothetical protein
VSGSRVVLEGNSAMRDARERATAIAALCIRVSCSRFRG